MAKKNMLRLLKILFFLFYFSVTVQSENIQNKFYIFISFSIPDYELKQLFKQAKQYNVSFIFKGLLNNNLQETLQKLQILNPEGEISILLDPILFQTYNIKSVPTYLLKCNNFTFRAQGLVPIQYFLNYADKEVKQNVTNIFKK